MVGTWEKTEVASETRRLTREELCAFVRTISDAEWHRLRRIARSLLAEFRLNQLYSVEDLINEAIAHAGEHLLPRDYVDVRAVLIVDMKTVCQAWRRKDRFVLYPIEVGFDAPDFGQATPEAVFAAHQEYRTFLGEFHDDRIVSGILELTRQGFGAAEICLKLGVNKTCYESARKRIKRRYKAFLARNGS